MLIAVFAMEQQLDAHIAQCMTSVDVNLNWVICIQWCMALINREVRSDLTSTSFIATLI